MVLLNKQQDRETIRAFDFRNWINNQDSRFNAPSDRALSFPEDHGAHPGVQSESWRFSGVLQDTKGKNFGFQVVFFRLNMGNDRAQRQSAWTTQNIYRAQLAYTPEYANNMIIKSRSSRDALGLAGYRVDQQKLWLHDWQLKIAPTPAEHSGFTLLIADQNDHLRLTLQALKPTIEISLLEPMQFYGISRLQAYGVLQIDGQSRLVSGTAYFDHAWGNLPMAGGQLVWNRFLLQMSNGSELIILQSRRRDGSGTPIHSGYWIDRNAKVIELSRKQFDLEILEHWQSQQSGMRYPVSWQVTIPDKRLTLIINAMIKDQEIDDAFVDWSGTVIVAGDIAGVAIQGSGLMQLSGYQAEP